MMNRGPRTLARRGRLLLPLGAAIGMLPPALPATPPEPLALEEVTVTAQRRETDLQQAAIAVSALSGVDFDRANLVRLDNFNGYVPGLTIAKNDGAGRVVAIRGVGWETAQNLSTQPSVLLYVDGVYLANPLSVGTDLGEIERVEVFRGPQGTEFGQGTTGGAINLVTRKPVLGEFSGRLELTAGSYDLERARGAVNLPLGERAAVRASLQRYRRDGFAEIRGGALDGYDLDDADSTTAKVALHWMPRDALSVSLSAFVQDSDQHAAAQKHVDDPNPDPRELTQDFPGTFALDNRLYAATVEWERRSGLRLRWISGYQELEKRQSVDGDRLTEALTTVDLFGFGAVSNWDVLTFWDNDSEAWSQELNLSYAGQRLDWTAGVYYLDHENFNHFLEAAGPSPFADSIPALANPGPDTLPPFMSVLSFVEARTVTRKDAAAYGQVRWRAGERTTLTAGLRYQREEQLDEAVQFFVIPSRQELEDSQLTWKLGGEHELSERHLLYGLVSTGWKNGGTNPGALNGALSVPVVFAPEKVTALEVGSKNRLAGDRVRLNLAAFWYDYDNLQFMQEDPVPFAGGTGNVPATRIWGVESEFNWLIAEGWRLDGHLAALDGEFTSDFTALDVVDFREALAPGVGLFTEAGFATRLMLDRSTNLNGNVPPKLVDLTARAALTHDRPLAGGELTARLEYVHRGEYQYRVFNHPQADVVPAYDVVNLTFDYRFGDRPLQLGFGATNLFDEDGVNSRFSNPFGLLTTSEEYIPPRELYVTLGYEF